MSTFTDEVTSGDRRRGLRAVRRLLAVSIAEDPRPRELASLSFRLMQVLEELERIDEARRTTTKRRT